MWNNFVGDQIRRANRNLLLVNALMVVCAGGYFLFSANFYKAMLSSGQTVSAEALSHMPGDEHKIIEVDSDMVMPSGYQLVETSGGSKTVKADFLVMKTGDRLMLVKVAPGKKGPHFTGVLAPMPIDLTANLQRDLPKLQTRGAIMPVILDTVEYKDEIWLALILGVMLLIGLWNLKKWMARAADPAESPIIQALQNRGGLMAAQQIDSEMSQSKSSVGKAIFTQSWVLVPYTFGMHVMHFDDVVWVYKKVIQRRVNFIPVGKSYAAVLHSTMGKTVEVMDKEAKVNELLTAITAKAPWAISGFTSEAEQLWKKNRDGMLQAVNARRSAMMKRAAQATVAAPQQPVPTPA
jgi:uncharacterized protein DUF6709